jgi:hypothetical protein
MNIAFPQVDSLKLYLVLAFSPSVLPSQRSLSWPRFFFAAAFAAFSFSLASTSFDLAFSFTVCWISTRVLPFSTLLDHAHGVTVVG